MNYSARIQLEATELFIHRCLPCYFGYYVEVVGYYYIKTHAHEAAYPPPLNEEFRSTQDV